MTADKRRTKLPALGATRTGKGGGTLRWNGKKWKKVPGAPANSAASPTSPQAPAFVPTLPSLSAEQFAGYGDLRQDASNLYENALVSYNEQMGGLGIEADKFNNQADRAGYSSGVALREQLSGGGLGFSPMFLNKGMRSIAGQIADAKANAAGERSAREYALQRMLSDAENARTQAISRIDRDMALTRSAGLAKLADQPLTPGLVSSTTPAAPAAMPAAAPVAVPAMPAAQRAANIITAAQKQQQNKKKPVTTLPVVRPIAAAVAGRPVGPAGVQARIR